jgi:transcriptional regulator with XRE-family HTH domain
LADVRQLSYDRQALIFQALNSITFGGRVALLTAAQMRAARALVGMEQKALAEVSGVSLPTIQRMEASKGVVRGVIDSLMKVLAALEGAGIEFINEGSASAGGGRGVRLRRP